LQILQSVNDVKRDSTKYYFKGAPNVPEFFLGRNPMASPAASPIPTWLLLVLMAIGVKRQRVDRRGSEAAGDGDECKGRDGDGCPFSTADYKQRRQSNGVGNGLKRYCKRCSKSKTPRPESARQHVDTAASTSRLERQCWQSPSS
jgi:hypothetical protein